MRAGGRVAVALAALAARHARADGAMGSYDALPRALFIAELLVPDIRYEIAGSGDRRWTVSVPLAVRIGEVDLGSTARVGFTTFCEAQYGHHSVRGILGARTVVSKVADDGVMLVTELGGIVGEDGNGAVVGAGLGWGGTREGVMFAVIGRLVFTGQERRGDIALDFQIPINAL